MVEGQDWGTDTSHERDIMGYKITEDLRQIQKSELEEESKLPPMNANRKS